MDAPLAPLAAQLLRARCQLAAGLGWFFVAALWNPWSVDWLIGSATIESPTGIAALSAAAILSLALALYMLLRKPSPLALRVNMSLLVLLIVMPAVGEGVLRIGIAADLGKLRTPRIYADPYTDTDYWKLRRHWNSPPVMASHPTLGWCPQERQSNPLGIVKANGYEVTTEDVILCFGDSFMAGPNEHPHQVPDIVEQQLVGKTVYNYGVGGYGVGQMYLRFLEATPKYSDPIVVVGIMTMDLDRTVLSYRGGPKPTFELVDGKPVAKGQPFPEDEKVWHQQNPVQIQSYAAAACVVQLRSSAAIKMERNSSYGREEKRLINRAIIEDIVAESAKNHTRLVFVTFAPGQQIRKKTWRDKFLPELLIELKVPWVDGRKVIEDAAESGAISHREFYRPDNHPNDRGNQLLGEALADKITELWGIEQRSESLSRATDH